jgi:DNA-binding transcriptional ArsR family regulator
MDYLRRFNERGKVMDPYRVIAAPHRMRILRLVWDRELTAGEIAAEFDVSWSAISQHLAVLKSAGFVTQRRAGRNRIYRADPTALGPLRSVVEEHDPDHLDSRKGPPVTDEDVRTADP